MSENMITCTNCRRDVAEPNYQLHLVHCQRHIIICERCSERVSAMDLDNHLSTAHAAVLCKKCNKKMEHWEIDDHRDKCSKRPVACIFCSIDCPWDRIKDHESYCGSRTEQCENCKKYIMVRDQERHPEECTNSSLPKDLVNCPNCDLVMMPEYLKNHLHCCARKPKTKKQVKFNIEKDPIESSSADDSATVFETENVSALINSLSKLSTRDTSPSPTEEVEGLIPVALYNCPPVAERRKIPQPQINNIDINSAASRSSSCPTTSTIVSQSAEETVKANYKGKENVISQLRLLRNPIFPSEQPVMASKDNPNNVRQGLPISSHDGKSDDSRFHSIGRSPTTSDKMSNSSVAILQREKKRISKELTAPCPICKTDIIIAEIQSHVDMCALETSKCPLCMEEVLPRDKDNHINNCKLLQKQEVDKAKKPADKKQSKKRANTDASLYSGTRLDPNAGDLTFAKVPCEYCTKLFPFDYIMEHQFICGSSPSFVLSSGPKRSNPDKLPAMVPDGPTPALNAPATPQENGPSMSTQPKSIASGDGFQSSQPKPFKRGRGSYNSGYRYDRNATPGEFLPMLHFSGFPDCYQIYQKVPVPPPFPSPMFFGQGASQTPEQNHTTYERPSYAEVARNCTNDAPDWYTHKSRWERASGSRPRRESPEPERDSGRSSHTLPSKNYCPKKARQGKRKTHKR